MKKEQISVQGVDITVLEGDFMSLTDLARRFDQEEPKELINNWMRLKDTVELLGVWEYLHNPNFKGVEFDAFKIRVVKELPGTNEFDRVFEPHPVVDEFFWRVLVEPASQVG